jgi:hypothetical protein
MDDSRFWSHSKQGRRLSEMSDSQKAKWGTNRGSISSETEIGCTRNPRSTYDRQSSSDLVNWITQTHFHLIQFLHIFLGSVDARLLVFGDCESISAISRCFFEDALVPFGTDLLKRVSFLQILYRTRSPSQSYVLWVASSGAASSPHSTACQILKGSTSPSCFWTL